MRPRLFWHVATLEARSRMSYRADFWLNAVAGFLVELAIVWFLWTAAFREQDLDLLGGRTLPETITYFLAVILLGKLVRGREFEGAVSHDIYQGSLNRYLVMPTAYLPFKYAQRLGTLAPGFVQFALFGAVLLFAVEIPPAARPTLASALMACASVACASLLYFLMDAVVHQVAFWADNVWSLDVAKWFVASLLGGYMLPLSIFPESVRAVLAVLPFRFLFDLPARVLLREVAPGEWALGLAGCLAWCVALAWCCGRVWRRGMLRYTGVGI